MGIRTEFRCSRSAALSSVDESCMRAALLTMPITTPGGNTMAGDIGNVGDPASIGLKHIDQVATYLATRQGASVKLETIALNIDGGDEHRWISAASAISACTRK